MPVTGQAPGMTHGAGFAAELCPKPGSSNYRELGEAEPVRERPRREAGGHGLLGDHEAPGYVLGRVIGLRAVGWPNCIYKLYRYSTVLVESAEPEYARTSVGHGMPPGHAAVTGGQGTMRDLA